MDIFYFINFFVDDFRKIFKRVFIKNKLKNILFQLNYKFINCKICYCIFIYCFIEEVGWLIKMKGLLNNFID